MILILLRSLPPACARCLNVSRNTLPCGPKYLHIHQEGFITCAPMSSHSERCQLREATSSSSLSLCFCSAQRGVLAGVDACASYRPAGCWCDKFCVAAADCCDSCPATCGATCPAAAAAQIAPRSASNISSLTGECGTARLKRLVAGYKEQQGVIAPRAFSAPLEARVQACQDALTQTDVSTPVVNIPVYVVNVRLGTVNAPYTSRPRANSLAAIVNTAYARAGYRFTIASVTNITFPDQDALDGTNCFNGGAATCERCNAYRQVVPASSQGSRALVWYMRFFPPVDPTQPVTLGAAFRAQDLFNPVDSNNLEEFSCIDGLWALALSDAQAGSAEQAVLEDSYTVIHEVGSQLFEHNVLPS